jgi:hypothetical protein
MSYRFGRLIASSTIARRRFDSTKSTELRFRALSNRKRRQGAFPSGRNRPPVRPRVVAVGHERAAASKPVRAARRGIDPSLTSLARKAHC